jgi:ribosome-associated heat shock protein Hsp15
MTGEGRCRLDVWLWRARFFKTRALASAHVAAGGVRLKRAGQVRRIDKPGEVVGPGDELAFKPRRALVALRIEAAGVRRGPAPEARALYALLDENDPSGHSSGA